MHKTDTCISTRENKHSTAFLVLLVFAIVLYAAAGEALAVHAQVDIVSSHDGSMTGAGTAATPSAPHGLAIYDYAVTPHDVPLAWHPSEDDGRCPVTDYTIQYKGTKATSWSTFNDGVSTWTYNTTVSGLDQNTSYQFRVAAINCMGTSPPSGTASATTGHVSCPGHQHMVNGQCVDLSCGTDRVPSENVCVCPTDQREQAEPVLNPRDVSCIVPQDAVIDYLLKMPPDDKKSFAEMMASLAGDRITRVHINGDTYFTEKGLMKFHNPVESRWGFTYHLFENDRIDPDKAEEFTFNMLDELGVTLDESSGMKKGEPPIENYSFKFYQKINNLYINGNTIMTVFGTYYTSLYIGSWSDGLSTVTLYDMEDALQAGRDHIFLYDELFLPDCNLAYNPAHDDGASLKILDGRPLYQTYAGTCQTPYMDGHYHWYEVYVDAITGKPLFVSNLPVF